ncbi:MAG: transposase [Deltaproteobacteria bacterium]|nr:transposase [Deltaproteobacteria bacterium]
MKKPWRDGTTALVFERLDLIGRPCAMVPPPWFHLTRFHGVLASAAALRAQVVQSPPPGSELGPGPQDEQLELFGGGGARAPTRKPWAWLLRHVFAEDVTVCPKCGERLRWLEVHG